MADGAIVQVADGHVIYRASAIGGCLKALLAARLEYDAAPTPEAMQKTFQAGHDAEEEALPKIGLLEYGPVDFRQLEVRYQVTETAAVVGHVDGLHMPRHQLAFDPELARRFVAPSEALYVAEIKSQSPEAWAERKAGARGRLRDRYDWQTSVYSHATGLPVVLWWFNRDTGEIEPELIKKPKVTEKAIREKILQVERLAETGVLSVSCDQSNYPCPYFYLHDEDDEQRRLVDWGDVTPEEVDEQIIDMLAASYKRNQREEKLAGERKDRAKTALRVQFKGKTIATETGWRVTFYEGRRTVEVRRVIEDDPFRQEMTWEQIRVTEPKKQDG